MQTLRLSVAAFATAAAPALAADPTFPLPAGCEAYVTVQLRNCQVAHQYRCAADPEGHQWSVYIDGEGPFYASRIDSETRWIESIDLYSGVTETLGEETDPASFTTLLQSGRDDFDFVTQSTDGEVLRFVGHDQLTGESTVVDGVRLEGTTFELTAYGPDGAFVWKRAGRQFVNRDWRIFYSDDETFENSFGDRAARNDRPVEFAFPGDTGFLTMEPRYDCDVVTAEAAPAPALPDLAR